MRPYLPEQRRYYNSIQGQSSTYDNAGFYFENHFSRRSVLFFVISFLVSNLMFFSRILSFEFWLFCWIEVVFFFYTLTSLSKKWVNYTEKSYIRKLFYTGFGIRMLWVLFSYFYFISVNGQPFEWDTADAIGYHNEASWLVDLIKSGSLKTYYNYIDGRYSDMGYPYYLGWLYLITGKSVFFARLLKAVYGAMTAILMYKLAKRNFGESVGRLAGILGMLMPNLIFYCGIHTKEVEMVLVTVLFMEQTDKLIRNKVMSFSSLFLPIVTALILFFFRSVLGATAVFALFSSLILTKDKMLGMGKRILLVVWISVAGLYFVGGKIMSEVEAVWNQRGSSQEVSMEWRAERENGNKFAKYAGGAVFAPMILVIPFPTFINTPKQEMQKVIAGGNYVKNVLAFFAIWAIFLMIKENTWRKYLLVLSFTSSYLIVLALSQFAQSERFHQPALPFVLILASYGISRLEKKQRKYFKWWLMFIFVVIVAWSWFKLSGRGMA